MRTRNVLKLSAIIILCLMIWRGAIQLRAQNAGDSLGLFTDHSDVGTVLHSGSVDYDASAGTYTIAGSGENMWSNYDAFQFVWKKASGDVTLNADISFVGQGGNPHRKAVLMIRQSLDGDSVYADVALHGIGLTSLQFREEKGATTHEVQANVSGPRRVRLEKRGDYFYVLVANEGEDFKMAAGSPRIELHAPFYVGIGVCSHDKDVVEKAVFSKVGFSSESPVASARPSLYSTLEIVPISSGDRRVVYVTPGHIEAPNWTRDGKSLLFNRNGHIERIPATGGTPERIDTGIATQVNNDHGQSPDGTLLAVSDNSQLDHESRIYIVPITGGAARRITASGPSYWHGWSPDGKTLAFCGERNGEFDVYTIPASGGAETRLTTARGLDDGPDYSPDGKYIYFNSVRSGLMQIWRMKPDGSEQVQITSDDLNNWFAHISPDGKWMVFITFQKDVVGHPANKDVMLRLMSLSGDKKIITLARLFGGQGTMNVPSWSPDSKELAFVSYELVP